MNDKESLAIRKRYYRLSAWLSLLFFVTVGIGLLWTLYSYPKPVGPIQPIPFSHKVHAGSKEIGCFVCHPEVAMTSTAGIPPLTTCMHCHSRIITSFKPIQDLHKYYKENIPVQWNQITKVPDFVYFPHNVHISRSIDCSQCHGNIKEMDRIKLANNLNMGFCMNCHRMNNVPVDCFTCHR